ncbi:GspE/PulE family protein [Rhodocaloribacter sp.]
MPRNNEAGVTAPDPSERGRAPARREQSVGHVFETDRPAEPGQGLSLDDEMLGDIWDELLDELTTLGVGDDAGAGTAFTVEAGDAPSEPDPIPNAESDRVDPAQSESPPEEEDAADERPPAPVAEDIDDELVRGLLHKGLVTMSQVYAAVRTQPEGMPLWRMLVAQKDVDMDAVFAEVARSEGFKHAEIDSSRPSPELIEELAALLPHGTLIEMLQLGLLPYDKSMSGSSDAPGFIFVTHDPTREAIRTFVESLDLSIELYYAPSPFVVERIEHLKGEGGIEEAAAPPFGVDVPVPGLDLPGKDEIDHIAFSGGIEELSLEDLTGFEGETLIIGEEWSETEVELFSSDETTPEGSPQEDAGAVQTTDDTDTPDAPAVNASEDAAGAGDEAPKFDPAVGRMESVRDEPFVLNPEAKASKSKDRVVTALMWKRQVSPKQVAEAVVRQKEGGGKELLWRLLARVPGVDAERVYEEAARVYAFPTAEVGQDRPDPEFVMLIMETVAETHRDDLLKLRLLPFEYDIDPQTGAARLIFITHDPARPEVHRILQDLNLGRFELQYAPESIIEKLIEEIFPRKNEYLERMSDDPMAFDLGMSYDQKDNELIDEDALEAEISRSSLINLFEATLVEAVRQGVSDIHIFPNPNRQIEIHFRVDGRLKRWYTEEKVHPESFLAVVKDNSINVDRFERDKAQDGFIQRWVDGALIRFRVSVLPIASAAQEIRAESIVIRVLDDRKVLTDLRKLGMLDVALERFDRAIRQPYGMVILTGPTGSGKSTTLVAALHQVVTPEVNVLTVEDPVEYIIKGVRQIKLNQKLSLEGALRAILRHDPDVVMVGEMRDRATAELAIKLANTGHLTFSTLHTNDAPSAVSRLYKMGVEPFLIAYAINLVVAQRLIRNLCPECKKVDEDPDRVMLRQLGFEEKEIEQTVFYTEGEDYSCPVCKGSGYKGRRAICETLYFTREIRHLIVEAGEKIDEEQLRAQAIEDGMLTLQDSARELVKMGATSIEEMMRVTASEG